MRQFHCPSSLVAPLHTVLPERTIASQQHAERPSVPQQPSRSSLIVAAMAEVQMEWSVVSCPFSFVQRAQKAIASAFMTSKVMVGWDVVSNIPDGVAPNGKQLWQAKWEENLEKTHRYSQSKGLKVIGVAIFGGGEGCKFERDQLQTDCGAYTAIVVPMNIIAFENACAGGQIQASMEKTYFDMWLRMMHELPDVWEDSYERLK